MLLGCTLNNPLYRGKSGDVEYGVKCGNVRKKITNC